MTRPCRLTASILAVAVAVAVAVMACGSSTTPSPSASGETTPVDGTGDWRLERGTVDGVAIPIVEDFDITMTVNAPSIVGTSACNSWGGRLALVDGELRVTEVASTMKLCEDAVMASETVFMRAIGLVRSATRDGDRLTLFGPGVEMVFVSLEPPPTADLIGPIWRLEALGEGDVHGAPIGDPATLHFDADGSFTGSTGCRSLTGTWTRQTGAIVATSMSATGECPADQADQDGFVVTVLGDGFQAQIDGNQLTLTAHGSTLLYVAEPAPGN